jgi:hypothetical protein
MNAQDMPTTFRSIILMLFAGKILLVYGLPLGVTLILMETICVPIFWGPDLQRSFHVCAQFDSLLHRESELLFHSGMAHKGV